MPKSESCKSKNTSINTKNKRTGFASFITTLFIVILPKCPFCIAAYSSTLLLFWDLQVSELSIIYPHIKPFLGLIILTLILFNYRGRKTIYALIIAILAFTFLVEKAYFITQLIPDWFIYLMFIFSVWLNGNFEFFLELFKKERN